ncbi:MAG: shikimate dehydrogenase [Clostridia bacterium]|nr:shikimate dehydrogenase [Clostridia bacterium]
MADFAFIVHPLDVSDIFRKFHFARKVPGKIVEGSFRLSPPFKLASIRGIRSAATGKEVSGVFIVCPLTTRQMLYLPERYVLKRIIKSGKLGEKYDAKIVGLGAMTSVVADAGITVAENLNIAVTTGNSYTVATAMEGTKKAAEIMGIDISEEEVVVVGATGSIGAVCARLMARECKYLTLIARNREKLDRLSRIIMHETGLAVSVTSDLERALKRAKVVITVTSSAEAIIQPEHLSPGAVVCDVARPRDVARRVAEKRKDVLVIEGGLVQIPGAVETDLSIGYPKNVTLACMAETMILALEGRYENFTLGRDITIEQVDEIRRLGEKHGFKLAGFRSFEKSLTEEEIISVKENAKKAEKHMVV